MPKRIEAPESGGGTGRPELFRKPDSEIPRESSIPETPPHQEITPEETPLTPETSIFPENLPEPELLSRPETRLIKEEQLDQLPSSEKPQKEPLSWLRRKIEEGKLFMREMEEKGILLTEKDKKKLLSIPAIWAAQALISTWVGVPIGGGSLWFLIRHRDPSLLPYNLIPSALRLGTILFSEKLLDVEFDWISKVFALFSGWAMPVEIALMSKEHQLLLNEIKERYVKPPLARVQSGLQKIRNISKK